ncbi:MAG: hypothetical protein ACE5D7_04810 [Fidelibacterota bacterium]
MKKLILTAVILSIQSILSTNVFAASLKPSVDRLLFLQEIQDSTTQLTPELGELPPNSKYAGKAMIYSGLVPGLGEYYTGEWKRGLIFAGIEVTSWIFWAKYNKKGDDAERAFENFADIHWDFSRWVADYYKWEDDDEFKYLFSKTETIGDSTSILVYENIWSGSHSMGFYYTHYESGEAPQVKLMNTNTDEFNNYFEENFENKSFEEIQSFVGYFDENGVFIPGTDPNFHVIQDGAYYENIGKYNSFFAGWDDNDSLSVYDISGYHVAKSPNKWSYRQMRRDSNDYKKVANYMISTIMLNHVASMIDAVLTTKKWNDNLKTSFSAKTNFDPQKKYGINGFQVDLTLKW